MKRMWVIISLLLFVMAFNSLAFGANDIINVSMNGSNVKVKEVDVLMDGQAFISDVPSFIYVDRTLVPVRFVAESFGAKVEWDQSTKTATVLHENKTVKLSIDSNKVVVNNETKTLDKNSIPKLVTFANKDSRTMVPVRFVSEVLGYEVGWDENSQTPYINSNSGDIEVIELNPIVTPQPNPETINPTTPEVPATTGDIKSIEVVKGSTSKNRIVIKSSQPIKFDDMFLPDSNKLVVDIDNARLNTSKQDAPGDISVVDNSFSRVTYSQFSTNPYTTRVVVELREELDYDIYTSEDGKTTYLTFEENRFEGIEIDDIDGIEGLVIENMKNANYKVLSLSNPSRIVIDLFDTNLAQKIYGYNLQTGFIKNIRVSQFAGDPNYNSNDRIVRIVLDIMDGVDKPNVAVNIDGDRLTIVPAKSIWEFIKYENAGTDKFITIKNNDRTSYDVEYDYYSKIMKITVPRENTDLIKSVTEVKDKFIEFIEITEDHDDTIISISFRREIVYDILSNSKAEEIILSLRRDPSIVYTDKTIVLDPGHGGKDPGAISPNGTREKDVNLQIGLKTQSLLESLGYDVIMTRRDDTFVDLYERANIANRNNADIFVSIHHNSTLNNSIRGLEILYCPRGQGTAKLEDQYPLAEEISKSILASTGGSDRGIIQRPGLVVIRETNMAAILVEVGYLSNSADEAQIVNDAYQNKVVEGIIKGIQNYFEIY